MEVCYTYELPKHTRADTHTKKKKKRNIQVEHHCIIKDSLVFI